MRVCLKARVLGTVPVRQCLWTVCCPRSRGLGTRRASGPPTPHPQHTMRLEPDVGIQCVTERLLLDFPEARCKAIVSPLHRDTGCSASPRACALHTSRLSFPGRCCSRGPSCASRGSLPSKGCSLRHPAVLPATSFSGRGVLGQWNPGAGAGLGDKGPGGKL
uniref:Uncharacterized protein n=1 Tax=Myotis myotis TaxID=51298 RepID=A0A7J7QZS0_MYOMY|nr:hypothetical protein mMyoMyo1_011256 [Myotis myotis]